MGTLEHAKSFATTTLKSETNPGVLSHGAQGRRSRVAHGCAPARTEGLGGGGGRCSLRPARLDAVLGPVLAQPRRAHQRRHVQVVAHRLNRIFMLESGFHSSRPSNPVACRIPCPQPAHANEDAHDYTGQWAGHDPVFVAMPGGSLPKTPALPCAAMSRIWKVGGTSPLELHCQKHSVWLASRAASGRPCATPSVTNRCPEPNLASAEKRTTPVAAPPPGPSPAAAAAPPAPAPCGAAAGAHGLPWTQQLLSLPGHLRMHG